MIIKSVSTNIAPEILVGHLFEAAVVGSRRFGMQDTLSNRLEVVSKMNRALERNNFGTLT